MRVTSFRPVTFVAVDSDEQSVVGTLERAIGYIKASNTDVELFSTGDYFGEAVSLSADGNTLAVGAYYEDSAATGVNGDQNDNSAENAGAVHVFVRSNGSWQQQAYVKASNTGPADEVCRSSIWAPEDGWLHFDHSGDAFGGAVSLSANGDALAVGARYECSAATGINGNQDDNSTNRAGAVYLY